MKNWALVLTPGKDGNSSLLSPSWQTYTETTTNGFPTNGQPGPVDSNGVPCLSPNDTLMVIFQYHANAGKDEGQNVVPPSSITLSQTNAALNQDFPAGGGTDHDGYCCYWGPQDTKIAGTFPFTAVVSCLPQDGSAPIVFVGDPEMIVKGGS